MIETSKQISITDIQNIFRPAEGFSINSATVVYICFPDLSEWGLNRKDSGNFARNLPQSKEISTTLGRKVTPFIMSELLG